MFNKLYSLSLGPLWLLGEGGPVKSQDYLQPAVVPLLGGPARGYKGGPARRVGPPHTTFSCVAFMQQVGRSPTHFGHSV